MDLELSRLGKSTDASLSDEDACARTLSSAGSAFSLRYPRDPGDPSSELLQRLAPNNRRFRQVITQLAPAIAPSILAPVTTTGPAGFDVAVETNITGIAKDSEYWRMGSRGHGDLSRATCDGENRFVAPSLTSNRVHFSKGLPFGLTLGGTVGKLYETSLWLVGMDVKLALVEGMRTWPVPDLAVRAAVQTAVGDAQYSLTVTSGDVILSKNLVTGRVMTISPYLGAGILWTFASSELVDLTPNVSSVGCAAGTDPTCNELPTGDALGASQDDVGHDVPFEDVSFIRYRAVVGLAMRYKLFALAAEAVFDIVPPEDAHKDAGKSTPRQWTINAAPSLSF
jgi:hypothetical protein